MAQTSTTHSPSFHVLIHSYLSLLSLSLHTTIHLIASLPFFFLFPSSCYTHKTVFITRHIITFTLISFIAAFFYFFQTFDHLFSFIYSICTFPQHQTKKRLSLLVLNSIYTDIRFTKSSFFLPSSIPRQTDRVHLRYGINTFSPSSFFVDNTLFNF